MKYSSLCFHTLFGFLTVSFCLVFVMASCLWSWWCSFWYCMLLSNSVSVVNSCVNLDLLFDWSVGYGKCILFPFAEVTCFSNENKVHDAQNKNQKMCMEKFSNLMFYLQTLISTCTLQSSIGWGFFGLIFCLLVQVLFLFLFFLFCFGKRYL